LFKDWVFRKMIKKKKKKKNICLKFTIW